MTKIIALDLSKRSTGWAVWDSDSADYISKAAALEDEYGAIPGDFYPDPDGEDPWDEIWRLKRRAMPRYGSVELGSEYTNDGQTFVKLHSTLNDIRTTVCRFDALYFEEPINPAQLTGHTNIDTLRVLSGLAAHALSFSYALGIRAQAVNITSWRRFFVGKMPRGTKTKEWKDYAIERCQQYGWKPRTNDEADALGILDYACDLQGITPPWRVDETLRAPLGVRT